MRALDFRGCMPRNSIPKITNFWRVNTFLNLMFKKQVHTQRTWSQDRRRTNIRIYIDWNVRTPQEFFWLVQGSITSTIYMEEKYRHFVDFWGIRITSNTEIIVQNTKIVFYGSQRIPLYRNLSHLYVFMYSMHIYVCMYLLWLRGILMNIL